MSITDCARCEKRRHTTLLRQLSEFVRDDDPGLVPDTVHGRMHRLARPRYNTLYGGSEQQILPSLSSPRRSREDSIYDSTRSFPLYTNAF